MCHELFCLPPDCLWTEKICGASWTSYDDGGEELRISLLMIDGHLVQIGQAIVAEGTTHGPWGKLGRRASRHDEEGEFYGF